MLPGIFTEVRRGAGFVRFGKLFIGISIGIIFSLALVLFFWNEVRSPEWIRALNEGKRVVVSVSSFQPNPANEGKLVHFIGPAEPMGILEDRQFGIKEKAIMYSRHVEMYQWCETSSISMKFEEDGSSQKSTSYQYSMVWHNDLISSDSFRFPDGHSNPKDMLYSSVFNLADIVTVNGFVMTESSMYMMAPGDMVDISSWSMPSELDGKARKTPDGLYIGNDPQFPQIGDVRIIFRVVRPTDVTVLAKQVGNTFEPYMTRAGNIINLLETGRFSVDDMFKKLRVQYEAMERFTSTIHR
jgi:hypothetical protein